MSFFALAINFVTLYLCIMLIACDNLH